MAKSKRGVRPQPGEPRLPTGETRAADAVTVSWMVAVATTLICGSVAALVALVTMNRPESDGARLFAALLHFAASISALVTLLLTAVVLSIRQHAPPPSITAFAIGLSLLVLLAAALL